MKKESHAPGHPSKTIQQLLTFHIDGRLLGIPVLKVRDVFRADKITPVPLAPPEIKGLINLRGHIVTSISLREKLGLPPLEDDTKQMNIAIEYSGEVYSLLVDKIGDVMELDEKDFERKPQVLDEKVRDFALGIYKLDDRLLISLDVEKTIQTCQ